MKYIKYFLGILAVAIMLFYAAFIAHLYKMYDYERVTLNSKFGNIDIWTVGDWKPIRSIPYITEFTEPYSIRISFLTPDNPGEKVEIRILDLHTVTHHWDKEKISQKDNDDATFTTSPQKWNIFKLNSFQKTSRFFETGDSKYGGVICGVFTKHEPITITFELHYKGDIENFTTTIQPKYWWEIRNNIWDAIMGI